MRVALSLCCPSAYEDSIVGSCVALEAMALAELSDASLVKDTSMAFRVGIDRV